MIWHRVRALKRNVQSAALAAALCVFAPLSTLAQSEVTITSDQGGLTLTGLVIGFDGEFLTLASDYGPLTLRYRSVRCDGADCPDAENYVPTFRFSGAARMGEVMLPGLVEGFARARGLTTLTEADGAQLRITLSDLSDGPQAVFVIQSTTSGDGFADLVSFQADAVMSLREVTRDERARGEEAGLGDLGDTGRARILGLDALVPVASPLGTTRDITLAGLAQAIDGRVASWSELDPGRAEPLSFHRYADGHGLTEVAGLRLTGRFPQSGGPDAPQHATTPDLTAAIAGDPLALGLAPLDDVAPAKALALQDSCGISLVPQLSTVKTEDYPLTVPLYLYLPERRHPPIFRDFLGWLRSPTAHLVVRRAGFLDPGVSPIPLDAQGQRFANAIAAAGPDLTLDELQRMVRVLTPRTRLSTTFRFEEAARLDAASRANLLALALALGDGDYDGRDLLLVGFSDGRGDAASNKALSATRAQTVRDALNALLPTGLPETVTLATTGFGEALPMGCDSTRWGRKMNRRVELWVK